MRVALLLASLVAVFAGGCAVATPQGLDGRAFLSTSVNEGGAERPLAAGTRISLGFQDGRLSANAGCNTMGGGYRIENGRLLLRDVAMTAMGCDGPRHEQDDWLSDFLGAAPTVAMAGNELALTVDGTVIRLVDRSVAQPDQPLVGPVWTVDSLLTADVASSVPAGATATLQFADDGTVAINAGCNTGTASVTTDGTKIRFASIGLTRRACPGPESQLETAVLSVLEAPQADVHIDGATLTINAGHAALVLVSR